MHGLWFHFGLELTRNVVASSVCVCVCVCVCVSCSVVSDSLSPHRLWPSRLFCPWILQARILEWVAIPFSRGSSWPRDWTQVSRIAGGFFTIWATREALVASYTGQIGLHRRDSTWKSTESREALSCACRCLTRENGCQAAEDTGARSHCGWKTKPVRVRLHHLQRLRTDGVCLKQNVFVIFLFHIFLSI